MEFVGDNMVISHFALEDASPDDYAAAFTAASLPRMIVPLRGALPTWLSAPRPMRIAGSNVISHHETTVTLTEDLAKSFDAMIYIEATTPSRLRQ